MAEALRRTPSPPLDEELPPVLPCFRLMLPDGALFTEDGVPIPVVIVTDLRAMADWKPPQSQRIGGISSASRRPHWRRGHWHTILHGEKRQRRRMQWFKPVYVGLS